MTGLLSTTEWRQIERLTIGPHLSASSRRAGRRAAHHRGAGMEFHDHRPYEPGDDTRDIDWTVYGRLDRLVVKLFRSEGQMSVHLLLDVSASMGFGRPDKLTVAKRAAAAVATMTANGHEPIGLALFSDRFGCVVPPRRGGTQLSRVLGQLDAAAPDGRSDFSRALTAYADAARSRGLAVVLTDGFTATGCREGLAYLAHRGFDVALIHVVADEELTPVLDDALEVRDLEDPHAAPVPVNAATVAAYRARMGAFVAGLKAFCGLRGIPYLLLRNSTGFDAFVADGITCGLWHRHR